MLYVKREINLMLVQIIHEKFKLNQKPGVIFFIYRIDFTSC